MPSKSTRRDFMKTAAAGVAGASILEALPLRATTKPGPRSGPEGEIEVRITDNNKKYSKEKPLRWHGASNKQAQVVLDPSQTYQEMLGFGAAFTDAACHNLMALPQQSREELLHELLHPSQMNFSVNRICIGSSDYSCKAYSFCDEGPDPDLSKFNIAHDQEHILPVLRAARKTNPDLFFLASPWSPPGWMKTSNSLLGGSFKKQYYAPYADYFVKFLQAYQKEGVAVNAVTVQNEVDTDQDSKMPACLWGQEYEVEFVSHELGPKFAKNNLQTKIWLIDHNYNLWGRAICELDDATVKKYVDGIAWHGYLGTPDAMTRVHEAHPDRHAYWTEGGSFYNEPTYLTDWVKWSATYAGILQNWARCIMAWNIVLDENGKPNIGPFSCGGVITVNSHTHEVTRSGLYWALAHYSRNIQRGARRIASHANDAELSHGAFINPDGKHVAVLTNSAEHSKTITLAVNSSAVELEMAANSIATLTWA